MTWLLLLPYQSLERIAVDSNGINISLSVWQILTEDTLLAAWISGLRASRWYASVFDVCLHPWLLAYPRNSKTRPLPHVLSCRICHSRSNGVSVITEIRRRILALPYRLSKSVKVIRTDMDKSATHDFLLVIHCNYGPISRTVSDINIDFGKSSQISPPCI